MQHQKKELQSALDAHKILAETAVKHMEETIEQSRKEYRLAKRFRRWMLFAKTRKARLLSKIFFYGVIYQMKFVVIVDYQMV